MFFQKNSKIVEEIEMEEDDEGAEVVEGRNVYDGEDQNYTENEP